MGHEGAIFNARRLGINIQQSTTPNVMEKIKCS